MTAVTVIVILLIYVAFALFVAAALSKKHKKRLAAAFGTALTVAMVSLAVWGLLRNVL